MNSKKLKREHRYEKISFYISMSFLMFIILFLSNILKVLKDSLMITNIGIESLGHIRIFIQLPLSFLIIYIFSFFKKRVHQTRIFKIIIIFYAIFIFVFGNILYPYRSIFFLSEDLKFKILQVLPQANRILNIIDNWPITMYYFLADLWPLLIYVNCFWELSNRITSSKEAIKIYPLYNIIGQSNIIITSIVIYNLTSNSIENFISSFGLELVQVFSNIALCIIILILLIYHFITLKYRDQDYSRVSTEINRITKYKQIFKIIINNKLILSTFINNLIYFATVCIIETLWFHFIKIHYNGVLRSLISFKSKVLFITGISTIVCSILNKIILKRAGWNFVSSILPYTMLFLSFCVLIVNVTTDATNYPILLIITIISIASKGLKYTFFDTTKEMAYIPLDKESKFYGKISSDTLAPNVGKVLGNIFQITFFTIYWNLESSKIIIYLIFILILLNTFWVYNLKNFKISYNKVLKQ
ncbi:MAG: hypothetical protein GY830_02580 [Bacteroidetes bacterium]|nr:hypothetical protein [Bacteroidota bacterium]